MLSDGKPRSRDNAMGEAIMNHRLSIESFVDGLSARALLSAIRRHLAVVLACTLSLSVGAGFYGLGEPRWYRAEGILVIHPVPQRTAEIQELPDPNPDGNYIQSEVDILTSRSVIEPVVQSLRLWDALEFRDPQGWSWQLVEARLGA